MRPTRRQRIRNCLTNKKAVYNKRIIAILADTDLLLAPEIFLLGFGKRESLKQDKI